MLWLPPGTSDPYELNNVPLADAGKLDAARPVFTLFGLLLRSRLQIRALVLAFDLDLDLARDLARILDRHRDRALARARAVARARDLDRARDLALARELARDLDRDLDLDLDRDLDLALARDRDRDLARELAHDLAYDLSLACDRARDPELARNRALARDLARDLERDVDLALGRDLALARDLDRDVDLAQALVGDRARDLDLSLARDLAVAIDETVNRYLSSRTNHGLNRPILDTTCRFFLGHAFSDAITEVLRSSDQPDKWTARFAAAFIEATRAGKAGHLTADPATMEATLQDAVTKLANALNEELADLAKLTSWHSAMAKRLRHNAGPVFARAEPPTLEKATAIRMAALCLAAEADRMERKNIGDQFRQVAAGITLLQHQATDKRQANEVVMLAVE